MTSEVNTNNQTKNTSHVHYDTVLSEIIGTV